MSYVGSALAAQGILRRRPVDDEEEATRTADFRPQRDLQAAQPRTMDWHPPMAGEPDPWRVPMVDTSGPRASEVPALVPADSPGPQRQLPPTGLVRQSAGFPEPRDPNSAQSRYEDELAAHKTEQQRLLERRPHGIKQRLLSAGKLGLKALALSGGNPIAGLTGLAIGAADRDSNARFDYRTQEEPRSLVRQKQWREAADDESRMQERQQTGMIRQRTLQRQEDDDLYERTTNRPLKERLTRSQIGENEAQAERARREPPVRQTPHFGPGSRTMYDPELRRMVPVPGAEPATDRQLRQWEVDADPNPPNFDAEIEGKMNAWRQGHYAMNGITPEIAEKARRGSSTDSAEAMRVKQAEDSLYQRAKDSVAEEANARKARNRAQIVRQGRGGGSSTSPAAGGAKPKVPVMSGASAGEAARRKGMTEPEFRAWFTQQGGVIR